MESKFICDGNQYIFFIEGKSIALPITFFNLPKKISVNEVSFSLKYEFHVTLFAIGKIIEFERLANLDFQESVLKDFCDFVKNNPIEILKYNDEFRFVQREDKKSIVVMCQVSNLGKFFELINKKYNLNLEIPPTHVTIYVLPGKHGIWLLNSKEIESDTKPIKIPELEGCFN